MRAVGERESFPLTALRMTGAWLLPLLLPLLLLRAKFASRTVGLRALRRRGASRSGKDGYEAAAAASEEKEEEEEEGVEAGGLNPCVVPLLDDGDDDADDDDVAEG